MATQTNPGLSAKASVNIKAPASRVWEALTDPSLIKKYFFGTEAVSDWKTGSPLQFKGKWEGKEYRDKGTVLRSEKGKILQYNYLSSFSELEDLPENYAIITYELKPADGGTALSVTQDNIRSEKEYETCEQNWKMVLNAMKELLEAR
jgi:uncharacterized protein YndB with AHSA1/START domain